MNRAISNFAIEFSEDGLEIMASGHLDQSKIGLKNYLTGMTLSFYHNEGLDA